MAELKKINFTKPPYKIMSVILNQCLRLNMGKLIFSIFLFSLSYSFLTFAASIPILPILQSGGAGIEFNSQTIFLFACSIVFSFIAQIFTGALVFGLFEIAARLIEKKKVTLGFLFIAFKKRLSKVFLASIIFTCIQTVFFIAAGFICLLLKKQILSLIEVVGFETTIFSIILPVLILILILIYIPFSFAFLILYTKNQANVLAAFILSAKILRGKIFHFVYFLIKSGGKNLFTTILLSVILLVISKEESSFSLLPLFSMLLSITRFFEFYKAAAKILTAIPLYFFFSCGTIQVYKSEYKKDSEEKNKTEEKLEEESKSEETEKNMADENLEAEEKSDEDPS